jgi:hypothetical protein
MGIITTLGIAVVGWMHAVRAGRRADRANDIAGEANEHAARAIGLAESAEARADRLERAQRERRDVRWEQRWVEETCTLAFRNIGLDTAYDVELVVDPIDETQGHRQVTALPQVAPTEPIGIRLETLMRERLQWRRSPAARARLGSEPQPSMARALLTWRSEHGTPAVLRVDIIQLM